MHATHIGRDMMRSLLIFFKLDNIKFIILLSTLIKNTRGNFFIIPFLSLKNRAISHFMPIFTTAIETIHVGSTLTTMIPPNLGASGLGKLRPSTLHLVIHRRIGKTLDWNTFI